MMKLGFSAACRADCVARLQGPWVAWVFALALCAAGSLQPAEAVAQQATVVGRFVFEGAEVTDTLTGLVWRRCSEGQTWTGITCSGSASGEIWKEALGRAKAAGAPWRLPNAKELASLVEDSRVNPAIDIDAFPGTPSTLYWTSTHYAGNSSFAWGVDFAYGYVSGFAYGRSNHYAVRLVRAGQ